MSVMITEYRSVLLFAFISVGLSAAAAGYEFGKKAGWRMAQSEADECPK